MNLKRLEYIVQLAELGSFTRAADQLDIAQPALSRQVRQLEIEMRHNLLTRNGQALFWAANLLHGGARQRRCDLTRWSQVTHYFFDDSAYYTPMRSDPIFGSIWFREHANISTGETVPNCYVGRPIPRNSCAPRIRARAAARVRRRKLLARQPGCACRRDGCARSLVAIRPVRKPGAGAVGQPQVGPLECASTGNSHGVNQWNIAFGNRCRGHADCGVECHRAL